MTRTAVKVLVEASTERCDPDLYDYDAVIDGVEGFECVGAGELESYSSAGLLLIRAAFPPALVHAARESLRALATSEAPDCVSISFEAAIRAQLEDDEPMAPVRGVHSKDLAIHRATSELPNLPPETRLAHVRKLHGFVDRHPALAAMAHHPALTGILERLLGHPPGLLQDMALLKPPGGREKPWHQDRAYFNVSQDTPVVAAWIALDEATADNGCLRLLPGGHRRGPRPHFLRRDWQMCDPEVERAGRVAACMSPGDCILFDGLVPHGTPPNETAERRWALQFHYAPRNVAAVEDEQRLRVFGGEGRGASC